MINVMNLKVLSTSSQKPVQVNVDIEKGSMYISIPISCLMNPLYLDLPPMPLAMNHYYPFSIKL